MENSPEPSLPQSEGEKTESKAETKTENPPESPGDDSLERADPSGESLQTQPVPPISPGSWIKGKIKIFFRKLLVFFLVILFFVILKWLVVEPILIVGKSMRPLLHTGDVVLVQKLSPIWKDMDRGTLIVFHHPQHYKRKLIKRVIGRGGDVVKICRGVVYINGTKLTEAYLNGIPYRGSYGPVTVPAHHYFVLGDNRNNSQDSRQGWLVFHGDVVGVAFVRILPLRKISGLR